jgi:hypothetical protein
MAGGGEGNNKLLLQYGKRGLTHPDLARQPPAKRVLFQRGPAFKSRFGVIGSPGGLHYQTNAVEEDRPENMRDAASKALDPSVVTAAEQDTANFLTMFALRASGHVTNVEPSPCRGGDRWSGKSGAANGGSDAATARRGVGIDDLYCEEQGLDGDDEDQAAVDGVRGEEGAGGSEWRRGPSALDADAEHADGETGDEERDDDDDDVDDGGEFVADDGGEEGEDDDDDADGDDEPVRRARHKPPRAADARGATAEPPAPRPPWYAAAERHALEHCAAVLRRIANSPPSPVLSSIQRRRATKQASGATSRYFDNLCLQPATTTPTAAARGAPGSPPLPRS